MDQVRAALMRLRGDADICGYSTHANKATSEKRFRMLGASTMLGLAAASSAIFCSVTQADEVLPIAAGFLLATTSLVSTRFILRSEHPAPAFLANLATIIAAGSFIAADHPLLGVGAVISAVITYLLVERSNEQKDCIETKTPCSVEVEMVNNFDTLSVNARGEALGFGNFYGIEIEFGEKLSDRVHLNDRVAFLRMLSDVYAGNTAQKSLELLFNKSAQNRTARFEAVKISICKQDDKLTLSCINSENESPKVKQIQGVSIPSPETNTLAIVSHELRTPLNAIIGFSDVLKGDLAAKMTEDDRKEYAGLIHGAGNHLLGLVNTILDVSKIESGAYTIHRDTFSFVETARESIAMVVEQAKMKNISINDRFSPTMDEVCGDRRAIKQVLINLLSNAVKYTNDGGCITLDATVKDGALTFEVSDTGIGMTTEALNSIGRPFVQVDSALNRSGEGTGLGLSLVKGLVSLHGGEIKIYSKPEVGTRVITTIPSAEKLKRSGDSKANLVKLSSLLADTKPQNNSEINEEITDDERKVG